MLTRLTLITRERKPQKLRWINSHCFQNIQRGMNVVVDRLNGKLNKKLLSSRWLKDKGDNFLFDWRFDFFWTACRKVFYLITVWDSLEPRSCDISDSFEYNIGVRGSQRSSRGIILTHFIRSLEDTLQEIGSTKEKLGMRRSLAWRIIEQDEVF